MFFYMIGFGLFPGVLEGLGSSAGLMANISNYPRTYKCPGSRPLAKNPPGGNFSAVYGTTHPKGCFVEKNVKKVWFDHMLFSLKPFYRMLQKLSDGTVGLVFLYMSKCGTCFFRNFSQHLSTSGQRR